MPRTTTTPRRARHGRPVLPALACLTALLAAACTPPGADSAASGSREPGTSRGGAPTGPEAPAGGGVAAVPRDDRDRPTGWGPTEGELARARAVVADFTAAELAGQVIVGRYDGTDPAVPARLVSDLGLAGVAVTSANVLDAEQVRATAEAVREAAAAGGADWPPVIGVDQEGGSVSHLRGVATEFPSFATAGRALEAGSGPGVVREAALATGLELRDLGFTWVFAPVADVTMGAGDTTIASRSPSSEPEVAARAVAAAVAGYVRAGVVSTTKHFPGHGGVTADSHVTLPELEVDLAGLRARELPPFEAAVARGAPSVMIGHLDVPDLSEPGVPASLAPETYAFLRDDLGFEGVAITDSLGMGAVSVDPRPALSALEAGADLLLMPAQTRATHRIVTGALEDGRLGRDRVEEAAARVVAVQLWQARVAEERSLPDDVAARAREAAEALTAAQY